MIFGSLVVAFCLIVLGWTAEIVGLFVQDPEKVWIGCGMCLLDSVGANSSSFAG
jgi:hypothetical protein